MNNLHNDTVLYLCSDDVEQACREIDSVAIIREVFRMHGEGQTALPDEAYLGWKNDRGEFVRNLNMPGYIGGAFNIAGTKIINANINNPRRGIPRASALTLLYDNETGRVVCLMEGAFISSLRTASVSALAASMLMARPYQTLAIIGAGVLARAHIELLIKTNPLLRNIALYDIDEARRGALLEKLAPLLKERNVAVNIASSAEEAIREAQLIIPVTTTTEGYIRYEWLRPGAVLVNVSLDDPLPEVVLRADKVIVDDWDLVKNDSRRLLGRMYRAGQVIGPDDHGETVGAGQRKIDAQLGDIVTGRREGRQRADEIILVNPFGLAIEDIGIAFHVYRIAREHKLGMQLTR